MSSADGNEFDEAGVDMDNLTEQDLLLLAELDVLFDKVDPVPADLVERVQFAIALEDLDVEVARWERAEELAGVRGAGPNTVTFTVEDLTIMVSFAPAGAGYRFDGCWYPGDRTPSRSGWPATRPPPRRPTKAVGSRWTTCPRAPRSWWCTWPTGPVPGRGRSSRRR